MVFHLHQLPMVIFHPIVEFLAIRIGTELDRFYLEEHLKNLVTERTTELETSNQKLKQALYELKKLSGLLPICSFCKKIRDDKGYCNQIEAYIQEHSEAEFSHSICQECAGKLYPGIEVYPDE